MVQNRTGVVYKAYVEGTKYYIIGSSVDFESRKYNYISKLSSNKWSNDYLQKVVNKYGIHKLKFEILQENIPEIILRDVENIWMGSLCSKRDDNKGGLNLTDAMFNNKSQSTIEKLRQANLGKKQSAETIEKRMVQVRGKPKPEGFSENIRLIAIEQQWHKRLNEANKVKAYQYSLGGEFIKEWNSITEASEYLNGHASAISACCSGKKGKHKGFMWSSKKLDKLNPWKGRYEKKKD